MFKGKFSNLFLIAVSSALILPLISTLKNISLPSWEIVSLLVVGGIVVSILAVFFIGFVMLVGEFNLVSNVTNENFAENGLGTGEPYFCQVLCDRSLQLSNTHNIPLVNKI